MIAVDIGNTSLHFAWVNKEGEFFKVKVIPTQTVKTAAIGKIISANKEQMFIVCSVVPALTRMFKMVKKELKANLYIVGEDIKVPIKSFYNTRHIGMDRLVAAFAAKKIYKDTRILIDFGTAITFDILSKKGDYEGGLILPGLGSTLRVLSSCALLPKKIKLRPAPMLIPRDTQASINKGITEGFSLTLNSLIERYKKILKIKPNVKVVITGGDARVITRTLKTPKICDQFLVIKGLILLAEKLTD